MRFCFFLVIVVIASGCSSTKSRITRASSSATPVAADYPVERSETQKVAQRQPVNPVHKAPDIRFIPYFNIEAGDILHFKYAIKMDIEVEKLMNTALYDFIDYWWGTPYKLGGATKKGIDCSAFTQLLLSSIYDVKIPRTAWAQKTIVQPVEPENLREGDLIFFNTRGRGISHVGIYLHDNKFVHAASSQGVMISSLTENYWTKKYAGAGRAAQDNLAGTDKKDPQQSF